MGSAGLFSSPALAAEPSVTASLQRTYTGTGQGTTDQCSLNAAHGVTPGDDSADDENVCTDDKVGYRMDLSFKTDSAPSPVTIVAKLGPGMSSPYVDGSIDGFDKFCVSRPGQWTNAQFSVQEVDSAFYPACTLTPAPNVNISYRQDLTVSVSRLSPDVGEARIVSIENDSKNTLAAAAGYKVIRALTMDVRLRGNSNGSPVKVGDKYYVSAYVEVSGNRIPVQGASKTKGESAVSDSGVKLKLDGAPEGTILTDLDNNPVGYIPFFNSGADGPGTQSGSGSPGDPVSVSALARVLVPLPATGDKLDTDFAVRVAQDSPKIHAPTGEKNMGEGSQIGQQLAQCGQSTDLLGGLEPLGSLPNNDCLRIQMHYNVPGDLISKEVLKDAEGHAAIKNLGNSQGDSKKYEPVAVSGDYVTSFVNLHPVPGSYPVDMCDAWGSSDQSIESGVPIFVRTYEVNKAIDLNLFDVYYSHQSGSGLACGNAESLVGWFKDPSQVNGAVNAVRIKTKSDIDTTQGISFAIPFTPNVDRTDLDDFGATPQLWDRGYVTTGRNSGWGNGAAAFSYGAKYAVTAVAAGENGDSISPGEGGVYNFYATADISGTVNEATPRMVVNLPACASLEGPLDFGGDWKIDVDPGREAGGLGCEDDVPTKVTLTGTHPFVSGELNWQRFGFPVHMSALARDVSQKATVHVDFVDDGLNFGAADSSANKTLVKQAAVFAGKVVDQTSIQRNEQLAWTMSLSNSLSIPVSDTEWIDVLPYDGDRNGSQTPGRVVLDDSKADPGVKVEYTKDSPASLSNDPRSASNQEGGSTRWCGTYTEGSDCPASLGEVTAVRYVSDLPSGTDHLVQLRGHVEGGSGGDTVVNRLGIGSSPDLAEPVPSPDSVTSRLFASELDGTVWSDSDKDSTQSSSEKGIAGVRLEALDEHGSVVGTTSTDEQGHYSFANLLAGTYTVRVVGGQQALDKAEETYSYMGMKGQDSSMTSSSIDLERNSETKKIDFGFALADSPSPSPSPSPSGEPSPSGSASPSPSGEPSPSGSATPGASPSPSGEPSPSGSAVPGSHPSSSGGPGTSGTHGGSGGPGADPAPSPDGAEQEDPSGSLAYTGARIGAILLIAGVLVAAGILLMRRRSAADDS